MAEPASRGIIRMILKNFINSFKPRQFQGTLVGSDYFGNKYYEIPTNPSIGKNKASRWFEPPEKEDFMQEMPAEWESWLRGRRKQTPSEDEVMKNLALMKLKKKNAIEIDKQAGQKTPPEKGFETFPKFEEYELVPGKVPQNDYEMLRETGEVAPNESHFKSFPKYPDYKVLPSEASQKEKKLQYFQLGLYIAYCKQKCT